jgi:hypothetical protein
LLGLKAQEQNLVLPATGEWRSLFLAERNRNPWRDIERVALLAVTDANLLLGQLIPEYFPRIFGKHENEALDVDASRKDFENLAQTINAHSTNSL